MGNHTPFGYDSTYGLLNKITYPDGGWVQYTWGLSSVYSTLAQFNAASTNANGSSSGPCYYQYKTPVITQRSVGYSSGSTAAQSQTFSYQTNWSGTDTRIWTTKTTTVTTTDNVTGSKLAQSYTYGSVNQPYQPNSSGQFPTQIPVENTVQYTDGTNTLRTVTKTWADQFEMTSETTTVPNVGSYGTAYCYFSPDCTKPSATFLGPSFVKYEYDFGNVPSTMPPSVSSPGMAARTTVYGYYGIGHPCFFTAPITYQTNVATCPISNSQTSIGGKGASAPPAYAQLITYA